MNIKKIVVTSLFVLSLSTLMVGCNKNKDNNPTNTEVFGGYSEDKKTYTLSTEELQSDIKINIPTGVIVKEDVDVKDNSYISLYNIQEDKVATKDDYVLTYKIVNDGAINEDKTSIEKLYKSLYADLSTSDIKEGTKDKYTYKYYTISYTLDNEKLTDYVYEIKIGDSFVLAKMGTTCYPLTMDENAILDTIFANIKN